MTFDMDRFKADIGKHEMRILREDGVARHVRFQRPGTMCMHFDLITWPGYLCYTGDMGTYVFKRLEDMFQFFRRADDERIDYRYWAEKVEASDKCDGIKEFTQEKFRAVVLDWFENLSHEMPEDEQAALRARIDEEIFTAAEYYGDEHSSRKAVNEFEHNGDKFFVDFWEADCTEYTYRFLWCCHALVWAIAKYDGAPTEGPT